MSTPATMVQSECEAKAQKAQRMGMVLSLLAQSAFGPHTSRSLAGQRKSLPIRARGALSSVLSLFSSYPLLLNLN